MSYVFLALAQMVEKLKIQTIKFLFLKAVGFPHDTGLVWVGQWIDWFNWRETLSTVPWAWEGGGGLGFGHREIPSLWFTTEYFLVF